MNFIEEELKKFKMKIKIIRKNSIVHEVIGNKLIISQRYKILKLDLVNLETETIGTLPIPVFKVALSKCRIIYRLLRMGIHNVIYLPTYDNYIVIAEKGIYLKRRNKKFKLISKINRGLRPLPQGICKDKEDDIYYGEYWGNKYRDSIYLYKSNDGGKSWFKQFKFSNSRQIRHIHGVLYDAYENKLWVTTGDKDNECGIYFSDDEGKTFNSIGGGDQSWRAVSLIFTKDYIYWGSDSPNIQNWIYRYHRKSGNKEKLQKVDGPVYYSTKVGNKLVFSTTVEKGEGEWDRKSHIWISDDGENWNDFISFNKDIWPNIFQYGSINFGNCIFKDELFFNSIGLTGIDGCLCSLEF